MNEAVAGRGDGGLKLDEPTGLGWSESDLARVGLTELRGLYTERGLRRA